MIELQKASFKGIEFLCPSVVESGGQKVAIHDYVNRDKRSVEDLGKLPPTFVVDAIITQSGATANDYKFKRDALKRVLNEGGIGDFVNPWIGSIKVKAERYSLNQTQNSLGEASFSITFLTASTEIVPVAKSAGPADVKKIAGTTFDLANNDLANDYAIDSSQIGNFSASLDKINDIADTFVASAQKFFQVPDGISSFNQKVDEFRDNVVELVTSPLDLGNAILSLYGSFGELQVSAEASFSALQGFFPFGSDDANNDNNTLGLIQRNRDLGLINSSVRVGALTEAYSAATEIEFKSVEDVDIVINILDNEYSAIKDDLTNGTRASLINLRNTAREFFDARRISAPRVIELNRPFLPAAVQSYAIYGSVDNTETLIKLNSNRNTQTLGGRPMSLVTE